MSEQRQEFVNAEIVDFVPVLVKDVETGLEPLLLLFCGCEAFHYFANFKGSLSLVD